MKNKIKSLITFFIASLNDAEKKISTQDLSVFFSILIATVSLRRHKSKINILNASFSNFNKEFLIEIELIEERFPDLVCIFLSVKSKLEEKFLSYIFGKLVLIFEDCDDDFDDMISWTYQYLKRDLEKLAFKKLGENKSKIEDSDLLFTTQFFTDKYMVKYIVDESLSTFNENNIEKVTIIDSASGGGNFLNYSFECLYNFHKKLKKNMSNKEIVDKILDTSLIGYDLDSNLSKIASLSVFVKACSYAVPSRSIIIKIFGGLKNDRIGFLNSSILSEKIGASNFNTELKKLNEENRIKVFVTNPPFMGKRNMDVTLKTYLLKNFPESKGDLCASFIQRTIQMMDKQDVFGVVSQNNWMYLTSFRDFRIFFLKKYTIRKCIDLGSNAFEDINGEKTNVGLYIIENSKFSNSKFFNLKFENTSEKRKLINDKNIPSQLTFELNQDLFLKNKNLEFNYQLENRFENIQKLNLYSNFANPMQGTSTGNNKAFVKFAWEVKEDSEWKLVSKGGGFSKWVGLNYYKVHWGENAEIIKANPGSALRNINKIKTTQLVYSDTGTLGLNVRILKDNQVFIASGPGIQVLKGEKYAHLAFLNSRIATFLLKLINPKFTVSAGYISNIPVAENILDSKSIATKSAMCLNLKDKYLQNKLPNLEFEHDNYTAIKNLDSYLEKLIIEDLENDYQRLYLESKIELEIKKQYNFNLNELKELKSVVGESPFFNKKKSLNVNIDALDFLLSTNIDLNCLSTSRKINGYSVGSESIFESLSNKLDINPKTLLDIIKNNISIFKLTKDKYYNDLLHKILLNEVGVKKITMNKFGMFSLSKIFELISLKYHFLNEEKDLNQKLISTIEIHHKISFFNRPLLSYSNNSIIIGQLQNG